jgi:hypothetical protein
MTDRFSAYESGQRRFARAQPVADYRHGTVHVPSRAAAATPTPAVVRPPDPPGLILGELEGNAGAVAIDLAKLLDGRLMIQGVSGAGKSWTLRRLVEQACGNVQVLVVDPEGEFDTLARELDILHVAGHQLDTVALGRLAARCREHRTSLVLDLSDCDREQQMIAIAPFIEALVEAPRQHWHPCLVAIDEAHLFAPFGGHTTAATSVRKAAIGAVVDLMGRGRKRGLVGVLATQRLARLAKSVTSEVSNFLIGLNTQDLDIKRAADQIGWEARRAFDRLPLLQPGEFIAVGRAFSRQPSKLKVGAIRSEHKGATPAIAPPTAVQPAEASRLLGIDELIADAQADDEDRVDSESALAVGARGVRAFIRDAAFAASGRVYEALVKIAPEGATAKSLAKHLGLKKWDVNHAVALLDQYGVLEFGEPIDGERAVAIDRNFLNPRGGA